MIHDLFISYAHSDNAWEYDSKGWIDWFHTALASRLTQIRGRKATIWRDMRGGVTGSSLLSPAIEQALRDTRMLLVVLSPAYVASEWCRKELELFKSVAAEGRGLRVGVQSRIVHVVKLPVPDKKAVVGAVEIAAAPGYRFFEKQPDGRPLEFTPPDGAGFYEAINTLAYDVADILERLDGDSPARQRLTPATGVRIFLAETSTDLDSRRAGLRHELEQFGYAVVPEAAYAHGPAYGDAVKQDLEKCRLSIHLVGESAGPTPERSRDSVVGIQYEAALDEERKRSAFKRFCWLPADLDSSDPDERYQQLLGRLANDRRLYRGTLEDFKAAIEREIAEPQPSQQRPVGAGDETRNVYLIFDQPDEERAKEVEDWLFESGFKIVTPLSDGSDRQRRHLHRDNLIVSDAVLIFHGQSNEFWLKTKLNDLDKIYGHGRKRPFMARAVVLADPATPKKDSFRSQDCMTLRGFGTFSPEVLRSFVDILRPSGLSESESA